MSGAHIIQIFAGLMSLGVFLFITVFYNLTLSRALKKCSPASRTMEPGLVWLLLIPLFNLIWHFLVVIALGKSLGNEIRARGIANAEPEPGKTLGIAMCVCAACCIIPILNILTGLAYMVLWIMYWSKIAGYSRMLDSPPVAVTPAPIQGI